MSGFTLPSPHCVSCPATHGRVLSGHRAQLQGELILDVSEMEAWLLMEGLWSVSPS